MQQLTGLDASFLYLETANSPMHVASLSIYDPSTAKGSKVTLKQIMAHTLSRGQHVPSMNNVLETVPMGLDHPYWRADGFFDEEYHIRHMALPAPGDWRQLCILVARLHARPLDRKRPLWEMNVIEGLDNVEGFPKGCFAVFSKVHHAAIDGASGVEMAAAIHDLTPEVGIDKYPVVSKTEMRPTNLELILRSQINTVKTPFRFISVARNTVPGFAKMFAGLTMGKLQRVKNIPRTRFNGNVSSHRVVDAVSFDFEEIRSIKNAVEGVTVNDVCLSIVGGALRKYLSSKDELPENTLAAMAPINVRSEDKKGTYGNQVSQMTVMLRTDVEGALERLQAVNEGTRKAKELTHAIGAKTTAEWSQFVPSTITAAAAKLASSFGLANQINPAFNCTVTNVPGLQIPVYFSGAKMLETYGMGPILDSVGLFHAICSYCGQMTITVTSCRVMMPDPAFYAQCIRDTFEELKRETGAAFEKKPDTDTDGAVA